MHIEQNEITPDVVVDLESLGCGDLVMGLMKALRPLPVGQIIQVEARDPGAAADIPAWCRLRGHTLLAGPTGPDNASYYIQKES